MNSNKKESVLKSVDLQIAVPTMAVLVALIAWIFIDNENVSTTLTNITNYYTDSFGQFYLVLGVVVLLVSLYLCFSKYGNIRIGGKDAKPEYSTAKYFSILFSGALGAGICIWGLAEPLYILQESVAGLEANSASMMERSLAYAFLHWGWIPWAFFGLPGIMYGFYIHNKKMAPRFTMPLKTIVGEKQYNSGWVKAVEVLLLLCSVAATPILLINGVNLVTAGLDVRFGIAVSTSSKLICCAVVTIVCMWSSLRDIKKGLGKISTFNIGLCLSICAFIFIVTDPNFIMHYGTSAMGELLTNFWKMALWSDPIGGGRFPQVWTIVYWIWWIVAAFLTGLIFANICKGRTIKQALLPIIAISPLMAFVWFSVWSGGALSTDIQGITDYVGLLNEVGKESLAFMFVSDLPLGSIVVIGYIILIATFVITTNDAFCLCYAQCSTKKEYYENSIDGSVEPPALTRILYCLLTVTISFLLLLANVDFNAMQALGAVTTFPCVFLFYIFIYALLKDLKKELVVQGLEAPPAE